MEDLKREKPAGLIISLITNSPVLQVDIVENGDNRTRETRREAHLQDLTPSERSSLLSSLPADSAPSAAAGDKAINGSDTAVCSCP